MARTRKKRFRTIKSIKSRKSRKSRKVRKSYKLHGGNKQDLVTKLDEMLQGMHHLTTADAFIDEVVNTMCPTPDYSSPKRQRTHNNVGPDGTPIDEDITPTHGPDGTPYQSWVSPRARKSQYKRRRHTNS